MSRLTKKLTTNSNYEIQLLQRGLTYVTNTPYNEQIIHKLGKLEDILEEYGIEDLTDLKIALDYYNHRFDGLHTERVDNDE